MGREVFEAALHDAETLAAIADGEGVEATSFEKFQYIPREVYEEKTGAEMPETGGAHPPKPSGEEWDEDGNDLERRFPQLWARFGE